MKYLQVEFITGSSEQHEILIAMLANIGFEGFEENDNSLKAFINEVAVDKEALMEIATGTGLDYSSTLIEQQNWNAKWESSFEPVVINDFAAIRAGFHTPVPNIKYEVVITPKMSFGTGHHATTFLMVEQMSQLDFTSKTVLDFGTGTGVLAILAAKMGGTVIDAIDNDDWSIDNAKENIAQNNTGQINIQKAETILTGKQYDIILANINLNVLVANMALIAEVSKPHTEILLSGVLNVDELSIKTALIDNGFIIKIITEKNNWLCIKATAP